MAMWHFRLFFLLSSLPRGNAVHLHLQCAAWAVPLRCILHRSTLHRFRQKKERMSYRRWYAHPPCYKSTQW